MQCGCTLGAPKEKYYLHSIMFMQNPPAGGTEHVKNHWNVLGHLKSRPKSFKGSPEDWKASFITLTYQGNLDVKGKVAKWNIQQLKDKRQCEFRYCKQCQVLKNYFPLWNWLRSEKNLDIVCMHYTSHLHNVAQLEAKFIYCRLERNIGELHSL